MIGILCEKKSAALNFAQALGGLKGNYNGETFIIANLVGHCYELIDPCEQVYDNLKLKYKTWNISNLPWSREDFAFKLKKSKGKSAVIIEVKSRFKNCDEIVIATDLDPTFEGELLAMELINDTNYIKTKKISRMYFLDEEKDSIQKAFTTRKEIDFSKKYLPYEAALYRQRFDFMSMQWTRAATCLCSLGLVLREGRLKSYIVNLVGTQIDAYNNYKKEVSYQNRFRDNNDVLYISDKEPIFKDKADVPNKYLKSDVVFDSKVLKHKAPPKLMNLSMISAKMSSKGISAKEVLDTYQNMYNAKILSYPRTEDKYISYAQFDEALTYIDKVADLLGVDKTLLKVRSPRKTHVKDGGSHGANRPTKNVPKSLDDLNRYGKCASEIYQMVSMSFLAMFGDDYSYYTESGHLKDYPDFKGSTNIVNDYGYKNIFQTDFDDDTPDLGRGLGSVATPIIGEIVTPRPKYPTLTWLVKQLEKVNVGTGATISSTYAEMTKKAKNALLSEKKGKISLTKVGEVSYKMIENTHIGGCQLTEMVQNNMKDISKGKLTKEECLDEISKYLLEDIEVMKINAKKNNIERGIKMSNNDERYYGNWKGKDLGFKRNFRGHYLTDEECEKLCNGESLTLTLTKKDGSGDYSGVIALDNLSFVNEKKQTINYVAPNLIKFAKSSKLPKKFCEHVFTDDERTLLEKGESVYFEGLYSKKKNVEFNATLKWVDDNKGGKKFEFVK